MIPKKVDADVDLNAQIDDDLKKSQEKQNDKIKKNRPKLAQAVGSKYFKIVVIVIMGIAIGYKMFFAPQPENNKKRKFASSKTEKVSEEQKMADASIGKKEGEKIQPKTNIEKKITSLDSQKLSNTDLLSEIAVPKLQLPKVPDIPTIDRITVKETIVEEVKQEAPKESKKDDDKNDKIATEQQIIKNENKQKNSERTIDNNYDFELNNKRNFKSRLIDDEPKKTAETERIEEVKKMNFVSTKSQEKNSRLQELKKINNFQQEALKEEEQKQNTFITKQSKDAEGNNIIIKEEMPIKKPKTTNREPIKQEKLSTQIAEEIYSSSDTKSGKNGNIKTANDKNDISNLGVQSLEQMFIMSGKGSTSSTNRKSSSSSKKDFILFDGSNIQEVAPLSDAQNNSNVNKLTNLENTISAGKIMEGVLAQAINSEAAGTIRAIISKDVYGESGNKILIPKGSSAYGSYTTTVSKTQQRLLLTWTKIIRPDGIVITMTADTYDQSGKKGIEGDVDTRYGELFKNSLLYSFITLGTAIAVEKLTGIKNSTTITAGGTSITNSPATAAVTSVIDTAKDIAEKMTDGLTDDLDPIISIPQGQVIHIVSTADIVVPVAYKKRTGNSRVVG